MKCPMFLKLVYEIVYVGSMLLSIVHIVLVFVFTNKDISLLSTFQFFAYLADVRKTKAQFKK